MTSQTTFEIKIAFCGYVNSGKSTLVNALLQQKFSEVSMHRTTMGVNAFRIFCNQNANDKDMEGFETISPSKTTKEGDKEAPSVVNEKLQSAADTHQIIAKANVDLRDADEINESSFNIEVSEAICDMRDDTRLVVVDLPGLTDVTSEDDAVVKYLNAKWDSYDCVVVVLDVMETIEKQVGLLNLVKNNLKEKKDIPVIFVCNKVDNAPSQEVLRRSEKLESTVSEIFAQNVYVRLCADDALVYRATSCLSFEKFQLLDSEWIDKIGMDEFSRSKWRKLSQQEKYDEAYKIISDASVRDEILSATNFPKFSLAIKEAVGGFKIQSELIQKQLSVALKAVKTFDDTTVKSISKIKCICERLGFESDISFKDHFWSTYKNYISDATEAYKLNTDHKVFLVAMSQLIAYHAELGKTDSNETERREVVDELVALVRLQFLELLHYSDSWQERYMNEEENGTYSYIYQQNGTWMRVYDDEEVTVHKAKSARYSYKQEDSEYSYLAHLWERVDQDTWHNKYTNEIKTSKYNPATEKADWYNLSMRDFEIAFSSILLASSSKMFSFFFGSEKIRMDSFLRKCDCLRELHYDDNIECNKYSCMFGSIAGKYNDEGEFVPTNLDKYNVFVHFKMPKQITDPEHWGHLAWKFCEFMEEKSTNLK